MTEQTVKSLIDFAESVEMLAAALSSQLMTEWKAPNEVLQSAYHLKKALKDELAKLAIEEAKKA